MKNNQSVKKSTRLPVIGAAILIFICGVFFNDLLNYFSESTKNPSLSMISQGEKKVLYWYDPMVPNQHFDEPGKSPFMDMELIPKYIDTPQPTASFSIDPTITQNLGMRLTTAENISVKHELNLPGYLTINERATAIVQLRTQGFVEKVWPLAAGDFVKKDQALAEFILPEWTTAQYEFLAIKSTSDLHLLHSARVRLTLLGMPDNLIQRLEKTNKAQDRFIIRAPLSGMISEFNIRVGMALDSGQTLARIDNLDSLWLEAAIPEDQLANYKVGDKAEFFNPEGTTLIAQGNIDAILPTVSPSTRTITARALIDNQVAQLKPGRTGRVKLSSNHLISTNSLAIPTEAIIRTGLYSRVLVVESNGVFTPKNIQPGAEVGERTLVLSGLEEGQKIVASAQFIFDSEASMLGLVTQKNTNFRKQESTAQVDTHQQHTNHLQKNHQKQEQQHD